MSEKEPSTNVYSFKDEKIIPDSYYPYSATLSAEKVPLVIDNGTYSQDTINF